MSKTKKRKILQGWQNPTLRQVDNQWRIYSDGGKAFVPLLDACDEVLEACPEAKVKLDEILSEPF